MWFKMATSCISVLMYNYKLTIKKKGSASYCTALFLSLQEFFQKVLELFKKVLDVFGKTLDGYYSMSSKITLVLEEIGLT